MSELLPKGSGQPEPKPKPPRKIKASMASEKEDPHWTRPNFVFACEIFTDLIIKVVLALVAIVIYIWGFYLFTQNPTSWPLATFESVVSLGWVYLMRHYFPPSKAKKSGR